MSSHRFVGNGDIDERNIHDRDVYSDRDRRAWRRANQSAAFAAAADNGAADNGADAEGWITPVDNPAHPAPSAEIQVARRIPAEASGWASHTNARDWPQDARDMLLLEDMMTGSSMTCEHGHTYRVSSSGAPGTKCFRRDYLVDIEYRKVPYERQERKCDCVL